MWRVTFNIPTGIVFAFPGSVVLAAVLFLGCHQSPERSRPQVDQSQIRLTIAFPDWGRNHSKSQVVLTFYNPTAQPRTVVLPCPLNGDAGYLFSPDRPMLDLGAKEPSREDQEEEGFVLAEFGQGASGRSRALTLKPGESVHVAYPLRSFYRCGPCGPCELDSFVECLQPGQRDVAVRAVIAYQGDVELEPDKGEHIESPPVVLKCAFPEWLFRRWGSQAGQSPPEAKNLPK